MQGRRPALAVLHERDRSVLERSVGCEPRGVDRERAGQGVAATPHPRDVEPRAAAAERVAGGVRVGLARDEDVAGRGHELGAPPVAVGAVDAEARVRSAAAHPDPVAVRERVRPCPALADVVAGIARHRHGRRTAVREALERDVICAARGVGDVQRRLPDAGCARDDPQPHLARVARRHREAAALVGADCEVRSVRTGHRDAADRRAPGRHDRHGYDRVRRADVGRRPAHDRRNRDRRADIHRLV